MMSAVFEALERLLLYALPVVVAAGLISPAGLHHVLANVGKVYPELLALFSVVSVPSLLIEVIAPRPGRSRLSAVLLLWLSGAAMISALTGFGLAVQDYFYPPSIAASAHRLIPYDPTAGFLLAAFALSMFVANGLWGTIFPILSPEFFIKATFTTGLVLFAVVVGLGYGAIRLATPPCTGNCGDNAFASAETDAASGSSSRAELPQAVIPPHIVIDTDDTAWPMDGYTFVHPDKPADLTVRWTPGLASRRHPHVMATSTEGKWAPAPGYRFANGTPGDFTVEWVPGQPSDHHPHVVAGKIEGEWVPAAGYAWLVTPHHSDFRVKWTPGRRSGRHPDLVAGKKEGEWVPAPRNRPAAGSIVTATLAGRSENPVSTVSRAAKPHFAGSGASMSLSQDQKPAGSRADGASLSRLRLPMSLDFVLVNQSPVPIVRIFAKPSSGREFGIPGASPDIGNYGQTYVAANGGRIDVRFSSQARDRRGCFYDFVATLRTGEPLRMTHLDLCKTKAVMFDGYAVHIQKKQEERLESDAKR